jgi:hypothetical protein
MSVHEETLTATTTCKNCDTTFEGKFCPNCAQKANTHRFTISHFAHEVFHAFTHTDKGILFLIKRMFRWPGIVAREYIGGKRKKYFNPITFLLITMAIQLYVVKKTDFYNIFIEESKNLVENISKASADQSSTKESVQALEKVKGQTSKTMENQKLITFIFLPVLAFLTWLFFKKSGFNYTENLIMGVFLQGQLNILFLLFCIGPFLLYRPIVVLILYIYMVILWAYAMLTYRQFFRQGKWVTVLKGSIVQILYFILGQQITNAIVDYL